MLRCATRGEQFHPQLRQSFGEVEQTGFIRDRKKSASDGHVGSIEFRENAQ
jgi:hypothetical protein